MKISERPTTHILIEAYTGSEWDCCDYAIIDCGGCWAESIRQRLAAVQHLRDTDTYLKSLFFDSSVSFHQSNGYLHKDELLAENQAWTFVELDDGELNKLGVPETYLDTPIFEIYKDGSARFLACGKHTGEDFITEDLPLPELIESLRQ